MTATAEEGIVKEVVGDEAFASVMLPVHPANCWPAGGESAVMLTCAPA